MILSKEGKYYFDEEKKEEYTKDFHDKIVEKFFSPLRNSINSFIHTVNQVNFIISEELSYIKIKSSLNQNENKLMYIPIELTIEIFENQKIVIDVFSEIQFDVIMQYYHIDYPIINSLILTKKIKESLFQNRPYKLDVINLPLKKIFCENIENKSKDEITFGNLSKYINLYMKDEKNFGDFPEKDYFKNQKFSIDINDKMDYYYSKYDQRYYLWLKFDEIINKDSCYFFSGPHGTGKTFSLLGYLNFNKKPKFHYIYYNLDIINKTKDFMKIFCYEARNLFTDVKEFISAFQYLKDNLRYPLFDHIEGLKKYILLPVLYLMKYIISLHKNIEEKYVIIIDQFKYIGDEEYDSKIIYQIKKLVDENKGFSLIVCSLINYQGIIQNLLLELDKPFVKRVFPFDLRNETCNMPENINENLSLLGYLPRYRRIANLINLKYINFMKKAIKRELFEFYKERLKDFLFIKLEDEIIKKLKLIQKNKKKILISIEMKKFCEDNPIEYFLIDFKKSTYDYLFPLIGVIIDEIIKSHELKHSSLESKEKEWYFKHLLFDNIKNKNIFRNIYIEKTIIIKTIFNKEKIKDFNSEINTLFYFTYSNLRKFDAVIFNAEKEEALLIQISIYKPRKKLSEYSVQNLEKDIGKIENKFFKVNGIKPKKYYLIFVFIYDDDYFDSKKKEELSIYGCNFMFYNNEDESFHYKEDELLKEIPYKPIELEDNEGKKVYIFIKDKYFQIIEEDEILYKPGYYYAEKGMTLLNFLEETCSEYENLINEISQKKISKYGLKSFNNNYFYIKHIDELKNKTKERIVLALNEDHLLIGQPIDIINNINIEYEWQEWDYYIFSKIINKKLNDIEKEKIESIEGFFIFEK